MNPETAFGQSGPLCYVLPHILFSDPRQPHEQGRLPARERGPASGSQVARKQPKFEAENPVVRGWRRHIHDSHPG